MEWVGVVMYEINLNQSRVAANGMVRKLRHRIMLWARSHQLVLRADLMRCVGLQPVILPEHLSSSSIA